MQSLTKYYHDYFDIFIEKNGFSVKNEDNDGQYFFIEYCSKDFMIKLENYRRDIYATVYKSCNPENGIALFNLLEYLHQNTSDAPREEYFRKEKDLDECYRKQLDYVSTVFRDYYVIIVEFFNGENYPSRVVDLEKFMKKKYPFLYPQ